MMEDLTIDKLVIEVFTIFTCVYIPAKAIVQGGHPKGTGADLCPPPDVPPGRDKVSN